MCALSVLQVVALHAIKVMRLHLLRVRHLEGAIDGLGGQLEVLISEGLECDFPPYDFLASGICSLEHSE